MYRYSSLYLIIIIAAILSGCSSTNKTYRIGISQCAAGIWRDNLNREMLAAQHLYEHDVKLSIVHAMDNNDLQIRQIDSLVETGIDLLIVSPNEVGALDEAIDRVHQRGIPVVCFDRKTGAYNYTAFIGCDNAEAGAAMGSYAASLVRQSEHRAFVMEVTGLMTTSPAQERHKGFERVMKTHSEIDYKCVENDWSADGAYKAVKSSLAEGRTPDVVFCHIDGMTSGVRRALNEAGLEGKMKILGFDGLLDEGIAYVQEGLLAGTYQYPTHGEEIIRLALKILTGQHYERDNYMQGVIVTPENADMVARNCKELIKQNEHLIAIHDKLENYFGLYDTQHKVLLASMASILLLLIAILLTWRAIRQHQRMSKEQEAFYTNASHQLKTPLTLIAGPVRELIEDERLSTESQRQLLDIVSRNVSQLEQVVSSVLNFKTNVSQTSGIDDATAGSQSAPSAESVSSVLQESRLSLLKLDDTDELPTILVVDDNDDMRRYLRTLLVGRFCVLEAAEGESGLKLARENVPDLIISDVMMPVMDGLQLCKSLKENVVTCHIPVILLTARSTEAQQVEGYEHGADAYLTKPFQADLLMSRINNLLKNRQQLRLSFEHGEGQPEQVKQTTQDKLFMDQLKEAIQASMPNADLKMDELGARMGVSRVQLYRKVKALTGLAPVELLRDMRLERGRILLKSTTKTIAEIAYEVGFGTPSYFTTCFKKRFGHLPMEERNE